MLKHNLVKNQRKHKAKRVQNKKPNIQIRKKIKEDKTAGFIRFITSNST